MTAHWGHLLPAPQPAPPPQPAPAPEPAPAPVAEPPRALEPLSHPHGLPEGQNEALAPVVANRSAAERAILESQRESILKLGVHYMHLSF